MNKQLSMQESKTTENKLVRCYPISKKKIFFKSNYNHKKKTIKIYELKLNIYEHISTKLFCEDYFCAARWASG